MTSLERAEEEEADGEFVRIARLFAPLTAGFPGALDLNDDVAFIEPPAGYRLAVTTDALVAGVHFFPEDPPAAIAAKLLRVNLSDLAAKGAKPLAYSLVTAVPCTLSYRWMADFAQGLAADQQRYGICLIGGDTVSTPGPALFSVTAVGLLPVGQGLLRRNAQPGDEVWVTGTLGDAALGLACLRGRLSLTREAEDFLRDRYRLPQSRLLAGSAMLAAGAHAGVDISDGLIADARHIALASKVALHLRAEDLPLSAAGRAAIDRDPSWWQAVLAGGDDYEALFTVPAAVAGQRTALAKQAGVAISCIGTVTDGPSGVVLMTDGQGRDITPDNGGYRHF